MRWASRAGRSIASWARTPEGRGRSAQRGFLRPIDDIKRLDLIEELTEMRLAPKKTSVNEAAELS
jgi:hypothetical protein